MTARRIDGKLSAEEIHAEVAEKASELKARGIVPTLAMMRIGEDPASVIYLRKKAEATIHVPGGKNLFADAVDEDMYAAIDALADKLDRQIKRHKEKRTDHHRETGGLKARNGV